jgi:hypothetical protein
VVQAEGMDREALREVLSRYNAQFFSP